MAETRPIGLPWNFPLFGEIDRSIRAPPRYRLTRRKTVATPGPPRRIPDLTPPLSLDDVVLHLRLAPDAVAGPEKALLEAMTTAAARHLEDYAGITLLRTDWRMTLRHFPPVWNDPLELPMPPLNKLERIAIFDEDQPLDDYLVEEDESAPARLYPANGFWRWAWSPIPAMITIDWIGGHDTPADIPAPLRQAMLMAIASWYENRESVQQFNLYPVIELGWQALLGHYRMIGMA
jgi:uncharacterized phiE125 gp8 family phage protein